MSIQMTEKQYKQFKNALSEKDVKERYPDIARELLFFRKEYPKLKREVTELRTVYQKLHARLMALEMKE
jgi:hypothetical protein